MSKRVPFNRKISTTRKNQSDINKDLSKEEIYTVDFQKLNLFNKTYSIDLVLDSKIAFIDFPINYYYYSPAYVDDYETFNNNTWQYKFLFENINERTISLLQITPIFYSPSGYDIDNLSYNDINLDFLYVWERADSNNYWLHIAINGILEENPVDYPLHCTVQINLRDDSSYYGLI